MSILRYARISVRSATLPRIPDEVPVLNSLLLFLGIAGADDTTAEAEPIGESV